MERIDYNTNRLPRGRRYANNGSVKEIHIEGQDVSAKVQGSRPKPYKIKISLNRFSNQEVKKIKEVVSSNPAIASELSLGKLPESLLAILDERKIHLLPQNWRDISADCSCPDWANPCKHLAAVYYIIANEIDKNPFMLFNLRGVPTESLIKSAGFTTRQDAENSSQKAEIFVSYQKINTPELQTVSRELTELPDLSFTVLDIDAIFSILPENPLFYNYGNFKKLLYLAYKEVMGKIQYIEIDEESKLDEADFHLIFKQDIPMFFVSSPKGLPDGFGGRVVSIKAPLLLNNKIMLEKIKGKEAGLSNVFDMFMRSPLNAELSNSPTAGFLNVAASVALAFIKSASFIPEVTKHNEEEFSISYIPLIHDQKAQDAVNYLKSIMPFNLCIRLDDNALMTQDGVYKILSLMITHIFTSNVMPEPVSSADCYKTFFRGAKYMPKKFEQRQTVKAVSDWLERLSIRKKDISPVIRIETVEDDKFAIDIDVENKKDSLAPMIPLSKVFISKDMIFSCPADAVRMDVSRQITIAGEYMTKLRDILNSRGRERIFIDPIEAADFISRSAGILNILGIRVSISKELQNLAMPRIAVRAGIKGKGEVLSYLSLDKMLDFSWEVAIGDKSISKEEFLKLAKSAKGIVRFKDQYLLLKPEEIKNILDKINKPLQKLSSMDMLHSAFTGEFEGMLFNPDGAVRDILNNITKIEDITLPATLNAKLRQYQERGFKWLYSNTIKGFGSCIADDMGLGKTIQVIALILKLKEDKKLENPALVVCPTTIVGNWQKECGRFAPTLNVSIYHGSERNLKINKHDVVVTTYGILRRDADKFKNKRWGLLITDEAQNIKNPNVEQTKAVKSIKADAYIAMSGTPVENKLSELWSIFDFANSGYLGQIGTFQRQYAIPIEKYMDKDRIGKLRRATAPFLLRRLKTDKSIISDLPDKVIMDEYCYLTKEQAAIYQQVIDTTMEEIKSLEGIKRKGLIFRLITSLKQICNHPAHYSKKGNPLKELSGKTEKAVELIEKIIATKEKVLIFTQYKEMGQILVEIIKNAFKKEPLFFHGGLSRAKRDNMVEDFQTNKSARLMIISLKAGGTGLNLTAASNVIHYDLWWNPAVEAQATDRTYRIGQDKNVIVHRLITIGTFEEKIDEMIKAKKELADLTVTTGEKWITELSNNELQEIFGLNK